MSDSGGKGFSFTEAYFFFVLIGKVFGFGLLIITFSELYFLGTNKPKPVWLVGLESVYGVIWSVSKAIVVAAYDTDHSQTSVSASRSQVSEQGASSLQVAAQDQPVQRAEVYRVQQNREASIIPTPAEVQSSDIRRPPYDVIVTTGGGLLRLRSCPITCDVVARLPNGLTVKIVGAGENGWPEIEAPGAAGATYHGFADGSYLK